MTGIDQQPPRVDMTVNPGICGFECRIEAQKKDRRQVSINIRDTDCQQVQQLAVQIRTMALKDLFQPIVLRTNDIEQEVASL